MHTLVVVEDVDVAEQATQFLDKHGISVHNYDFDHKDPAIAQSFRSGEIPILITTVEEDFYEEFTGTATNVFVVDVLLFSTSQYLSYKELLSKLGGHLTFYVDNDNWLSVAYVIKQLLEQGISLTTDPYPPSPKSPSSPDSHPSMADDSVCLFRLDSLALVQCKVDELKYESARLAEQIQQLSCKLNVPQSHTDMAPELVHTDSNHPCTRPQANISRSEFVPQDLDSSATDDISESITEYVCPGMPYSQVDSPTVFSLQSSNCSDNGDNVPTQSQDEYPDTQTDQVLAENISDYDYDDNHSQPSLDDENTHCYDSDYQHGYPPDPPNLKDHSDLDSSWNSDQDSWLTLDSSRWPPPVLQENPPTEAGPPETMVDEQSLAFPLTESQVVMAGELARLQQELQSVKNTLADKHDHFALASKAYEQAIQHLLASNNRLCHSITQLQAVMRPSCSPTQSPSDVSLAQAKDVNGSHVNPDSFPYPSVDCIQECPDTPVLNGIQQRLVLHRPKSRPQLSLKKDVPSWLDVPRPQPKPRLSLKRASKVPNSPDVCHQDSPVPAIASEDVYHASTCTPTLSDSDLGVSDEVETCIPSPVASPDLNDTYSSGVGEALSHIESAMSHAYAVLEHSLTCDIKLHPPDKSFQQSSLVSYFCLT